LVPTFIVYVTNQMCDCQCEYYPLYLYSDSCSRRLGLLLLSLCSHHILEPTSTKQWG